MFAEFTFVGAFPAEDVGLEGHAHEGTALPVRWMPRVQYVFHLDADADFEEIPTRLLPDRLRSVGATIIDGPKSWGDMAIPNTGNPIWQIEFVQGRYRGQIRNRYDKNRRRNVPHSTKLPRNQPDVRIDDYILTFAG